ncbi:unnamed protein product [Paramecium sonneborni]|uniref:Uncharacterized protein n=1 Tax=Paramecium sonneborni TaxID=65129 RepID=A0A8S1RT44_9CILI|nr:unnamed protein product [Paramecium sonneborni]
MVQYVNQQLGLVQYQQDIEEVQEYMKKQIQFLIYKLKQQQKKQINFKFLYFR